MAVQRRKGRVASRGGVAEQFGFLGEGVLLVLGWLGQLVAGIWSLLAWTGKRVWASIEGEKGRTPYGMALAAASLFTFVALFDYRAKPQDRIEALRCPPPQQVGLKHLPLASHGLVNCSYAPQGQFPSPHS